MRASVMLVRAVSAILPCSGTAAHLRFDLALAALAVGVFEREREVQRLACRDGLLQIHHHQMLAAGRELDLFARR